MPRRRKGAAEKPRKSRLYRILNARKIRRRRRVRRLLVVVAVMVLFIATLGMFGAASSSKPEGVGGVSLGFVDGIPHADLFNDAVSAGVDPRLLAAVAFVGTAFDRDVISCARPSASGRLGIMQLLPEVAASLGVDPCDPAQAIPAAARYLQTQFTAFTQGDLAIAAYHAGPSAVAIFRRVPPYPDTIEFVAAVMSKWNAYLVEFPSPGGLSLVGGCPSVAEGSTVPIAAGNNTVATQRMANTLITCFGRNGHGVGCYDPRVGNGRKYEHPRGRACDFMLTSGGTASGHDRARGQAMAEFAAAHAAELNIIYVIWFNRVWRPSDGNIPWAQWRDYGCGNCDPSAAHYNHVHVSVHLLPGDPPLAHCISGIPCTE